MRYRPYVFKQTIQKQPALSVRLLVNITLTVIHLSMMMVRLSQDFKTLLPLIDMHGNNGSIDGDPPAAMRYTECRLSSYAEALLEDLNTNLVIPNFDDEEIEPVVLPANTLTY